MSDDKSDNTRNPDSADAVAPSGLSFSYQDGLPFARGADDRLATWLNTDVQGSVEIADQIIASLENPEYEGDFTGNAHSVTIRERTVLLQSLFDDTDIDRRLDRETLLQALREWRAFITTSV